MPVATETLSRTLDSLSLKGKATATNGTSSAKSLFNGDLKVQPLEPTGALDQFEREELATALGDRFAPNVRLKEILALPKDEGDAILRDLAILSASTLPPEPAALSTSRWRRSDPSRIAR